MKKPILTLTIAAMPMLTALAQSSKVQTAWRQNKDYEETKDVSSLMKAKDAIDLATANEETKDKAKTWVYRTKIYYNLFLSNFKKEQDKLTNITDKNEKVELAYGNVTTAEYEEAGKAMEQALKLDKEGNYKNDLGMLGMQMLPDVSNIAIGKFKAKKYDDAISYFEKAYDLNKNIMGTKDTSSLFNCVVAAQKANNNEKTKIYAQKMIDEKVANVYTYQSLLDAKMALNDMPGAQQALREGRAAFPNDLYLMNRETEFYLQQGKLQEALDNLNKAIEKEPKNGLLFLVRGNVFDNLANPKDATGKDKDKPQNFEELMGKAAVDYTKATELSPDNFDVWYNTGALYNNWGGYYQNKASNDLKKAKEYDAKALEQLKKAVPALEKALNIKPEDKGTMQALRKLYLLTEQPEKAKEMSDRLKK